MAVVHVCIHNFCVSENAAAIRSARPDVNGLRRIK
jgi:hypothetical protein